MPVNGNSGNWAGTAIVVLCLLRQWLCCQQQPCAACARVSALISEAAVSDLVGIRVFGSPVNSLGSGEACEVALPPNVPLSPCCAGHHRITVWDSMIYTLDTQGCSKFFFKCQKLHKWKLVWSCQELLLMQQLLKRNVDVGKRPAPARLPGESDI